MQEISLSKIKKTFGFDKNILDDFDFEANTGDKIALIGSNGSGKTTVFKIIIGEESIQEGTISIRKNASIGLLSQIPPQLGNDITIRKVLVQNLKEIFELEQKMRQTENKMAKITDSNKLNNIFKSYAKIQQDFETMNGYEVESKVSKICNGFGIKEEMMDRSFNSLSGGEKTIVSLATLMIDEPSILLLDEPTNHLDINTLEWFEDYLKSYKGTVIISSHDRYFLDKVVTKTVLIEKGKSEIFHGNYSYYLEENERRIMREFENFKNQQKQIEAMKNKIKKLQEFGRLAFPGGESFFKRAASIQKRLDKIELLNKPIQKKELPLDFQIEKRSGKDVLVVQNLGISLGNKVIFENAEFIIGYGKKICLMGPNGSGKSTFIKALLGIVPLKNGNIILGSNVNIGYIPQEIKFENDKETILDYARRSSTLDETSLRSSLAKFMFHSEVIFKRVGKLSGGEKVRLKLFELIQNKSNLLIMDEPTNHIDIETKEILEEALQDYKGTLLFISHDRYFINKLAEIVLNIENKSIKQYYGNYDYFKKWRDSGFSSS